MSSIEQVAAGVVAAGRPAHVVGLEVEVARLRADAERWAGQRSLLEDRLAEATLRAELAAGRERVLARHLAGAADALVEVVRLADQLAELAVSLDEDAAQEVMAQVAGVLDGAPLSVGHLERLRSADLEHLVFEGD